MLFDLLTGCDAWFDRAAVRDGGGSVTYGELASRATALVERLESLRGQPVGLLMSPGDSWIAAAAAMDRLGCRSCLLAATTDDALAERLADSLGMRAILHNQAGVSRGERWQLLPADRGRPLSTGNDGLARVRAGSAGESSVVLFTSGTTGEPKATLQTWASLAGGIRRHDSLLGMRMLLTYDLSRYAGLQVLLTALLNGGQVCIPASRSMADIVKAAADHQVELVSGTPTFWRMFLANSHPSQRAGMPLRQITLGGEPVRQPILDTLRLAWPAARITHIYASTEMGVCFSVHDGREGFPVELLSPAPGEAAVEMKVESGRLWIRSKRAMAGYVSATGGGVGDVGGWFDTGDEVEIRAGRVHFFGRQSSRINVGGDKVYPEVIEAVLRELAGVTEVRVSGVASSIAGQIVQAEIVPAGGWASWPGSVWRSTCSRGSCDSWNRLWPATR
jgi:acyl-CoA synthetase (AMP-forming)/AMP-acid ligase II